MERSGYLSGTPGSANLLHGARPTRAHPCSALCTKRASDLLQFYPFSVISSQAHSTGTMSHTPPTTTPSPNFETIFTTALEAYKKKTKKDIASHPLATKLQSCDSSDAILAVLRAQVQANDQAQSASEKWTKWLDPTVNVVFMFSAVLNVAGPVITIRQVAQVLPLT